MPELLKLGLNKKKEKLCESIVLAPFQKIKEKFDSGRFPTEIMFLNSMLEFFQWAPHTMVTQA